MSEYKAYIWARRMEEKSWKGRQGQISSHLECQRGACSLFCRQGGTTEGLGGRAETVQSKLRKNGGRMEARRSRRRLVQSCGSGRRLTVAQRARSWQNTSLGRIFLLPGRLGLICDMA